MTCSFGLFPPRVSKALLALLTLTLGLAVGVAPPKAHAQQGNAAAKPVRATVLASVLADFRLALDAAPGASSGTLTVNVEFWRAVTDARVILYLPREMSLDSGEAAMFDRGEAVTLWEGSSAGRVPHEFTYTVPVKQEVILQAGVKVLFTNNNQPVWPSRGIYYFNTDEKFFVVSNHVWIRKMQLQQRLIARGLDGRPAREIYERDRALYWDLEYPFEKPQPEIRTVRAPDGTDVEYVALPRYLLDTMPDSLKMQYNNQDWALENYQRQKRKE